eukprot:scaffold9098_cov124-Isochrysis_galbana.AAC.6
MNVQVNDEDAVQPGPVVAQRDVCRDANVVEDAEALSAVEEGVVSPTREVAGNGCATVAHGPHCGHRATSRGEGAADRRVGPREAHTPVLAHAHPALHVPSRVLLAVRRGEVLEAHERGRLKFGKPVRRQLALQALAHQSVLAHRKAVIWRQGHLVQVIVKQRNRRPCCAVHGKRRPRRASSSHADEWTHAKRCGGGTHTH